MYQAVPQPVDPPGALQVVLVLDVPGGHEVTAAYAARLADEFGTTISRSMPGVHARRALVTAQDESATAVPVTEPGRAGLTVELADRQISMDGRHVRLAYREFELLAYLARRPHRTVSRDTLLQNVWKVRATGRGALSDRTVDTHVRRLRTKLGEHAHILTTVRGQGYRFDPGTDVDVRVGVLSRLVN